MVAHPKRQYDEKREGIVIKASVRSVVTRQVGEEPAEMAIDESGPSATETAAWHILGRYDCRQKRRVDGLGDSRRHRQL